MQTFQKKMGEIIVSYICLYVYKYLWKDPEETK